MLKKIQNIFKKKDSTQVPRNFRISVAKKPRDVFVNYETKTISFNLKEFESGEYFSEILSIAQKHDKEMKFGVNLQTRKVDIVLSKERINKMLKVEDVRGFFTEIRIPVKKFMKTEFFII